MRTAPAQLAHYTRPTLALALAFCLVLCAIGTACGSRFPHPEWAQVDQADYVEVTSSPRPAPVEFVPPRPRKDALWVDGSWEYVGDRYGWKAGTWAIVPPGLRRARWIVVRRKEDGQLFFAPSTWKDASGKTVDDSAWIHALGPQARARSRLGETVGAQGAAEAAGGGAAFEEATPRPAFQSDVPGAPPPPPPGAPTTPPPAKTEETPPAPPEMR